MSDILETLLLKAYVTVAHLEPFASKSADEILRLAKEHMKRDLEAAGYSLPTQPKGIREAAQVVLDAEEFWNGNQNKEAFDKLSAALDGLRAALAAGGK